MKILRTRKARKHTKGTEVFFGFLSVTSVRFRAFRVLKPFDHYTA
jgi:hypothetical protein